MNLYWDDDTAGRQLVQRLSNAGHVVVVPGVPSALICRYDEYLGRTGA